MGVVLLRLLNLFATISSKILLTLIKLIHVGYYSLDQWNSSPINKTKKQRQKWKSWSHFSNKTAFLLYRWVATPCPLYLRHCIFRNFEIFFASRNLLKRLIFLFYFSNYYMGCTTWHWFGDVSWNKDRMATLVNGNVIFIFLR